MSRQSQIAASSFAYGPASASGSTNRGLDAAVSIENPRESIASQAVSILLVEDDLDTLSAYARLLRMDGHIVHTADGYQAALEVARRERVDLAICDIGLWDGNGCDLLRDLRKLQTVKGIAVTGFTLPDEVEDYRAAGFAAVLPKPLQHSELRAFFSLVARRGRDVVTLCVIKE